MKLNFQRLANLLALTVVTALGVTLAASAQGPRGGLRLISTSFAAGANLPVAHTCDGAGTSPGLRWSGAPRGTRSFVLVLFDPNARPPIGFVHWVIYDLPATVHALPSGRYTEAKLPNGGVDGDNGARRSGFTPPCPPAGPAHHYTFTLYALRVPTLGLAPGASRDQVLAAMKGKVLAQAQLIGLYAGHNRPGRGRRGPGRRR